jgi:hypothetical protein
MKMKPYTLYMHAHAGSLLGSHKKWKHAMCLALAVCISITPNACKIFLFFVMKLINRAMFRRIRLQQRLSRII